MKAIPIGISNFEELRNNNYYFVDKTNMIQEFLERKSKVTLITRPRRFGKTLNMSMMASFFDVTKDSKYIFENTEIMNSDYINEMNRYPTIFISFANAKRDRESIITTIKKQILSEWAKYEYVFKNQRISGKRGGFTVMTLNFEAEVNVPFDFDVEALAGEVINFTLEHEDFPYEPEVNLTLVDNEGIHAINKEFREIDRPTDVLSFPMLSYENAGDFSKLEDDYDDNFNPDTGEIMLGDIVISVDKVLEQAESYGHTTKREYAFLIVHSMLHLFGYDHMTPEEAAVMEAKQKQILDEMNITR